MYIKVKVTADSKKEEVVQKNDDTWLVSVKEPASENRANNRVREILKFYFQTNNIRLINGHKSPNKLFLIN
ncbi:MAG: DUF167 domain-containing protein [Candidatus Paceibacterota bacterium]